MNYHITRSKFLVDIFRDGLKPIVGENSKKVNDLRKRENPKLCFSEGFEGEILMSTNFFMRYQYDKSCGVENFEEYMKQHDVMLAFDDNLVENENTGDIADAHTTNPNGVQPQDLKVVRLQNQNGKCIYDSREILKYMMSQIPMQEVTKNNKLLTSKPLMYLEQDGISDKSYSYFLEQFYERNRADIEKYKSGDFHIDYQDFKEYCSQIGIGDWSLTDEEKANVNPALALQEMSKTEPHEKQVDYTK